MQNISGPYSGHYIATWACPMGEFGSDYIGYARVCDARPRSYWDCQPLFEVISECSGSEKSSMRLARMLALHELELRRLAGVNPPRETRTQLTNNVVASSMPA